MRYCVFTAMFFTMAVFLRPETGQAQRRPGVVRLSPVIGLSLPFGGAFIDERFLHKQQVTSAILSARIDVSATRFFGVEAGVSAGRGLVAVRDSSNAVHDIPGTILLSNLKGILWLNPGVRNGIIVHVASGLGLIGRSGKVWQDTKPKGISPAWVIALGGNARLTPRGPVEFRFELEDYVSQAEFNVGLPSQTRPLLHHDLVWSVGVSFPIMGRWK